MVTAVVGFTRMKLMQWRREADEIDEEAINSERSRYLQGFEHVFECFKVNRMRSLNNRMIVFCYAQEAEKAEDDLELEKRREACRNALRKYLRANNADNGVCLLALKRVLFNIRVTFVQHPMDLIGRRMAAAARDMAIRLAHHGNSTKGNKPISSCFAPLFGDFGRACTVRRVRKFKLARMIIVGPLLTLSLYAWDMGTCALKYI